MATNQQATDDQVADLGKYTSEERLRSKTLLQRATYRLSRDYLTMTAMAVLVLMAILAFSAPLLVKLLDVNYNFNDLYLIKLPPGSEASESTTTLQQWRVADGQARRAFVGHIQRVTYLEPHEDGVFFLSIGEDNVVRTWNTNTGGTKRRLAPQDEGVTFVSATYQPAGVNFAVGRSDGIIETWEREKANYQDTDAPIVSMPGHEGAVNSLQYGTEGLTLVSGGEDGTVRLWDSESGSLLMTFSANGPVNAVAYSADQTRIVGGGADGTLTLWDANTGDQLYAVATGAALERVYFSTDDTQILTASGQSATIRDAETGEQIKSFEHDALVNSARFVLEDTQILTASENGTALLWDIASGEVTQRFDDFTYPMSDAIISADGETILTGSEGRHRSFVLGTDTAGRDQFTRLLYGGQVSLMIGFLSAIGTLTIGIVIGVTAGYFGGIVDDIIMWVITTLDSIPFLYLLLIVSALLAPNATSLILVLVALVWTGSTRIVRGETFSLREREYVVAARALGASNIRIMFRHIAPNVLSILLIVLTRLIGNLILAESALSFLGFGVKPPTPTWGNMLSNDLDLLRSAPHLVIAPGLMITVTVLCLFIIGDGLRDAFDPTQAD